ncbi:spore coat protein U domain-containing protein [Caenimonas terrae]|uniref:Spore coat protein U domain-containing protein n=1 Tax=Caenimonas terrae TaxID=696074 RepID=A0ABW0NH02_9BURK
MKNFKLLVGSMLAAGAMGGASLAHAATTVGGDMIVSATLTSACEVSASGGIAFGSVTALASTGDKAASNATGFTVACSSDMSPKIYSTTTRAMLNGANSLPFELCLGASCSGSNDVPLTQGTAAALSITKDGSMQAVPLSAKILAADFKALPAGAYAQTVTINVDY